MVHTEIYRNILEDHNDMLRLKSEKNNGYFTWRRIYIYNNISLNYFYNEIKVVEWVKTHFMFHTLYSENRAIDEIMSKTLVKPERQQMTISYGACALYDE